MADKPHLLIVEARYYEDIAAQLLHGAVGELEKNGATHETVTVPGVFEIPAVVRMALNANSAGRPGFAAYIALGCVIRGETDHNKHVADACVRGLTDLTAEFAIALGFGILTCDTQAQAMERAAVDRRNKGAEAARAALAMLEIGHGFGVSRK